MKISVSSFYTTYKIRLKDQHIDVWLDIKTSSYNYKYISNTQDSTNNNTQEKQDCARHPASKQDEQNREVDRIRSHRRTVLCKIIIYIRFIN